MPMLSARSGRTMTAALLGAVLVLPVAAQAACPAVGSSWLQGDCSPRSYYCEKIVVTGHGWLEGRRAYKADHYFRTDYGWNYRYSSKTVCY